MKLKHKLISAVLSAVLLTGAVSMPNTPFEVTAAAASTTLAAPTGVKTTQTGNSVKLSWNKVSGAGGYRVYKYNASTKKYEKYKDVTGTTCTVKGLKASTTYKFKVATLKFTTQSSSEKLSKKTSSSATSVKLTWSAVKGAGGYRVYKYNASTKKYEKYKDVLTTSCSVTKLKASTTYKFKVTPLKFSEQNTTDVISAKTTGKTSKPSIPVTPASDFEYGYTDSGDIKITRYLGTATAVNIPSKIDGIAVREIGEAFAWTAVSNVIIPDSVTTIGEYAFSGCFALKTITIPNSVTTIGNSAFSYSTLASVTIPNSVTTIGECAFNNCKSLTSVTIPNSVTTIEDGAFASCESLTSVTIPNSVTTIDHSAFFNCSSLKSITIPNGVTYIGPKAFEGCTSLTSVKIPNSVTYIGSNAFEDCTSLKSVKIPNGVKEIGVSVFRRCTSLTSVTIPKSVTTIERFAFEHCESLTSITIPNSVTAIGAGAFKFCTSLKSITLSDNITSVTTFAIVGQYAFDDCSAKITYKGRVYFPSTYKDLYKAIGD